MSSNISGNSLIKLKLHIYFQLSLTDSSSAIASCASECTDSNDSISCCSENNCNKPISCPIGVYPNIQSKDYGLTLLLNIL